MKISDRPTRLLAVLLMSAGATAHAAGMGGGISHFTAPAQSGSEGSRQALPDEALIQEGTSRLDHGEFGSAIDSFEKATATRPDGATYFLLGYAHYARSFIKGLPEKADKKDAQAAVDAYLKSLAADPWMTRIEHPYKLYHSMGLCYEALGQNDKAVEAYDKAIAAAPNNPLLPLYVARLWLKGRKIGKATAQFRLSLENAKAGGQDVALSRLVKTSPLFAPMLANASMAAVFRQYDAAAADGTAVAERDARYSDLHDSVRGTTPAETAPAPMKKADQEVYDRLGAGNDEFAVLNYRRAITAYNDSLTLAKRSGTLSPLQTAFIYERIGVCYNKLGLSAEAIDYLRRSLALQPMSPNAHYQLALAHAVSGRYEDSLKALEAAFQAAPMASELKRYVLLSKTDSELAGVRDLTAFRDLLARYEAGPRAAR